MCSDEAPLDAVPFCKRYVIYGSHINMRQTDHKHTVTAFQGIIISNNNRSLESLETVGVDYVK